MVLTFLTERVFWLYISVRLIFSSLLFLLSLFCVAHMYLVPFCTNIYVFK